jgi:hypothetical protein
MGMGGDEIGSPDAVLVCQGGACPARTRRGKIARLPVSLREEVNRRLQNGEMGSVICAWLNGLSTVQEILASDFAGQPIGEENISRWRAGGFLAWVSKQESLEAIALLGEEMEGVQEAAHEGLANRMALVLVARLAVQLRAFEEMPEGPAKSLAWRDLLGGLVLLRRGDLQAEKLRAEKERFEHRKFRNAAELEEAFLRWVEVPENKARVRAVVFSGEKKSLRERRKEEAERVERVKSVLGIH